MLNQLAGLRGTRGVVHLQRMSTTITAHASAELREALQAHPASLGKSLSEFVRDTLESAVAEHSKGELASHVAGKPAPAEWQDGWHRDLRERNWRS